MRVDPKPTSLIDVSRPFANEKSVSSVAQRDADLIDGRIAEPADLVELQTAYSKSAKGAGWTGAIIGGAVGVATGVLTTATLGAFPVLLAAGAAVGAGVKWLLNKRHQKGEVQIENGSDKRTESFVVDPTKYARTASDLRLIKTAEGELGDEIKVGQPPPLDSPDPALLAEIDKHRTELLSLGKQRRLLADFKNSSRYGHDLLDSVDAATARKLLASGYTVFVLEGKSVEDVVHRFKADSKSEDGKVKHSEQHEVIERRLAYGLTEITKPEDLPKVKEAQGLPASFSGVYKNSDLTPQIVHTDNQVRWARVDGKWTRRDQSHTGVSLDKSLRTDELDNVTVPLTHGDVNAGVAFAFAGGMLGAGIAAMAALPAGFALIPAAITGAIGYYTMDGFLKRSTGQATEG